MVQVAIGIGDPALAYQRLKIIPPPPLPVVVQVAIGIGDPALAYQCLKIAVSVCPSHAESYNNLGVLEYRKGNDDQARSFFRYGGRRGPQWPQPGVGPEVTADPTSRL